MHLADYVLYVFWNIYCFNRGRGGMGVGLGNILCDKL